MGESLRAAEQQMGRRLPGQEDYDEDYPALGRFKYDAAKCLRAGGMRGYLATCAVRRERSCTREASRLLLYESQLKSAKLAARGVVLLMTDNDGGTDGDGDRGGNPYRDRDGDRDRDGGDALRDADVLSRLDRLHLGGVQDDPPAFTVRITPVLRTMALEDSGEAGNAAASCRRIAEIGSELAKLVFGTDGRGHGASDVFKSVGSKKEVKICAVFNGRKLVAAANKLDLISSVCGGFASEASPCKVSVDLKRPDVLLVVDAISLMPSCRTFLLVGVAPSSWLDAQGKLRALGSPTSRTPTEQGKKKRQKVEE